MEFLIAAYGLVWVLVFAYVAAVAQQQKRLHRRVDALLALQEQYEEDTKGNDVPGP